MSYPYSFIEEWWGESLSPELQQRIETAPRKQLDIFKRDLYNVSDRILSIPPKADGILRPAFISLRGPDLRTAMKSSLSSALNVLLYAHEIVIDSMLGSGE